jgi:ribosomal protein L5
MHITFVTSAKSDADAKALLIGLGMPLRKTEEPVN